jgi:hypothetical protein
MDTKLLIDGIVRQTTLLIAQLSTAAGIRAPSHIADRVFLSLARQIEAQGVGRSTGSPSAPAPFDCSSGSTTSCAG